MRHNKNTILSPLYKIEGTKYQHLYIKRDDLIHPLVSGNKWRKLEGQPLADYKMVITFGGAFSNHLVATAYFAYKMGLASIGIIRGEEIDISNPTLHLCAHYGMQILGISRIEYQDKENSNAVKKILHSLTDYFILPEGGTNAYSSIGFNTLWKEVMNQSKMQFDVILCAYGTGGTGKGLFKYMPRGMKLVIMPAIKGVKEEDIIAQLNPNFKSDKQIIYIPTFQNLRYGKVNADLLKFVETFFIKHQILLDPIYTSRLVYNLLSPEYEHYFLNKKILLYHSGGNQGWGGIFHRYPSYSEEYPILYQAYQEYLKSILQ